MARARRSTTSTSKTPRSGRIWTLPTLTAHETIPGHAWQGAYLAEHHDEIPLIMSLMGFNAFVEGWALYAEQLVDELGYYDDDPLGRLGYLQGAALPRRAPGGRHRPARQALVARAGDPVRSSSNTGRAPGAAQSEIDRYCLTPGQACGYKVGHTEIVRLREHARTELGPTLRPARLRRRDRAHRRRAADGAGDGDRPLHRQQKLAADALFGCAVGGFLGAFASSALGS